MNNLKRVALVLWATCVLLAPVARAQEAFTMVEDEALGALVLPPELESAVYVFRRRDPA